MDFMQQFSVILNDLLSSDNNIRKKAEEDYDKIPNETKISCLLKSIEVASSQPEVRTIAAVLLRRVFSVAYEDFTLKISPEVLVEYRTALLKLALDEADKSVSRKICDAIAELARNMVLEHEENAPYPWPELLQFLFNCVNSDAVNHKLVGLYLFVQFPGVLGEQQTNFLPEIKQRLLVCLTDQTNPDVRFLAARASIAFVTFNEGDQAIMKLFQDTLPHLIMVCHHSADEGVDESVFKQFIELAETMPKFLRPQIEAVLEMALKISGNTDNAENWRQLAFELLPTIAESAPQFLRKHAAKYMPEITRRGLQFMTEIDDIDDWSHGDEADDDLESICVAGETGLDRIACGVGGKCFLQYIYPLLAQLLSSANWKERHASLMALSAIGEGCHSQMEAYLSSIVPSVIPYLKDSHPRVRYAACNAMGQMASDFQPSFHNKFHENVVPNLLFILDDNENPRVQAHAAAALVNFSEDCPKHILDKYLQVILFKLQELIQSKTQELVEKGTKAVLEQAVTTLAAVADAASSSFLNFYDNFMPNLKFIMQNATHKELRMLRGKTIECISLIGLAVGQEKFMNDAVEVMDLLLKAQINCEEFEDDDPQVSYMMSAWARMCKLLGAQFQKYLPAVMEPLMKVASHKPEIAVVESDEMEGKGDDEGWQFVSLGDNQSFGIKTAGLEDKATACHMLVCYAKELKEGFAEYTEQVVQLMIPLLKFYFHDGVRSAAAESIPYLLECAKVKGTEYLGQMWAFICPKLLEAITSDPENDVASELMSSFAKSVELLGFGCLTDEMMSSSIEMMGTLLDQHFRRHEDRQEKRKDEDYDEGVEEMLQDENEDDVYLLSKIADVIHSLFTVYREKFLPVFDKLLHKFHKLLMPERPYQDHQFGVCIFDDLIEFSGEASWSYQNYFLEALLKYSIDNQAEVRQAASYGLGLMAMHGGQQYTAACASAIPLLKQSIALPEARTTRENICATENCVSAIGKIIRYQPGAINRENEIANWLNWLPIYEDKDEVKHVFNFFCELIEANDPIVLGQDNSNLPRVLAIFAEAFAEDAFVNELEVAKRCALIINQAQANEALFNACISHLPQAHVEGLQRALLSLQQ